MQRRRLALVHGFTQTSASWGPVAQDLAADHEVVALDAPGHGRAAPVRAGLRDGAAVLAAEAGRATWVGYSMGARFALHVALERPEAVAGLVLLGATAGIEDPADRRRRRHEDEARARRLEAVGVDAFLDEWLAQPLFAGLGARPEDLAARRTNTVEGLAASLRLAGTGTQEPLWDRLGQIEAPALLLAGERDGRFADLAERMAGALPAATFALVPGAGHAAHLEQPDAFLAVVRPWLDAHPDSAKPAASRAP